MSEFTQDWVYRSLMGRPETMEKVSFQALRNIGAAAAQHTGGALSYFGKNPVAAPAVLGAGIGGVTGAATAEEGKGFRGALLGAALGAGAGAAGGAAFKGTMKNIGSYGKNLQAASAEARGLSVARGATPAELNTISGKVSDVSKSGMEAVRGAASGKQYVSGGIGKLEKAESNLANTQAALKTEQQREAARMLDMNPEAKIQTAESAAKSARSGLFSAQGAGGQAQSLAAIERQKKLISAMKGNNMPKERIAAAKENLKLMQENAVKQYGSGFSVSGLGGLGVAVGGTALAGGIGATMLDSGVPKSASLQALYAPSKLRRLAVEG